MYITDTVNYTVHPQLRMTMMQQKCSS